VADLQRWVSGKLGPIFPGLATKRTRKLIKLDLAEAGIPHKTDVGVRCFHSLRNTYISALFDSGASMPSTQRLARHSVQVTTFATKDTASARDSGIIPPDLRGPSLHCTLYLLPWSHSIQRIRFLHRPTLTADQFRQVSWETTIRRISPP
jgi:hypothetical protein